VALYHIMRKSDESFWDIGINYQLHKRNTHITEWKMEQEKELQEFMNHSREILLNEGFAQETVPSLGGGGKS